MPPLPIATKKSLPKDSLGAFSLNRTASFRNKERESIVDILNPNNIKYDIYNDISPYLYSSQDSLSLSWDHWIDQWMR